MSSDIGNILTTSIIDTLADGERMSATQVQELVDAMSGFSPPPMGQVTLVGAYGAALAGVIDAV